MSWYVGLDAKRENCEAVRKPDLLTRGTGLRALFPLPLRAVRRRILEKLSLRPQRVGISFDPQDRAILQTLGEEYFKNHEKEVPLGTVDRGRLILRIIGESFPTENLAAEYFRNLEHLLKARKRRKAPGQVLIGLGTGRSGSTSLSALLATIDGSCSTHENPPLIFWRPEPEQLEFHMRRFKLLVDYFALVTDVSHWWLPALNTFLKHFPNGRILGLHRDLRQCVRSFMVIRGYGWGSWNHWVPYGNGIWISHLWDPTYPTYPAPDYSSKNPDRAKNELITRYVTEYNDQLAYWADRLPDQVMLIKTEALNEPTTQRKIFNFAGNPGRLTELNLNLQSVSDAENQQTKF